MITNMLHIEECIMDVLKAGLVPMITSDPGVGKSSIAKQIADKNSLELIDIRLSQCDPTDLNGFPKVDGSKATYIPMDTFPVAGDAIPEGKRGWLILLDEFNSASLAVQAAAYKLVLDKHVGQHPLHSKVAMMGAGNLSTSNAIVNKLSTAMQSRLVHMQVETNNKKWNEWALENDIDHRIISFIEYKPELLHKFDPKHNDLTFPCPRTWEFFSKIVKGWTDFPNHKIPLLAGIVGEGAAREFVLFSEIYKELPPIHDMLANPSTVTISNNPSINFAISGIIGYEANQDNLTKLMTLVNRLPMEFQVITIRGILKRHNDMESHAAIQQWITTNYHHFMDS